MFGYMVNRNKFIILNIFFIMQFILLNFVPVRAQVIENEVQDNYIVGLNNDNIPLENLKNNVENSKNVDQLKDYKEIDSLQTDNNTLNGSTKELKEKDLKNNMNETNIDESDLKKNDEILNQTQIDKSDDFLPKDDVDIIKSEDIIIKKKLQDIISFNGRLKWCIETNKNGKSTDIKIIEDLKAADKLQEEYSCAVEDQNVIYGFMGAISIYKLDKNGKIVAKIFDFKKDNNQYVAIDQDTNEEIKYSVDNDNNMVTFELPENSNDYVIYYYTDFKDKLDNKEYTQQDKYKKYFASNIFKNFKIRDTKIKGSHMEDQVYNYFKENNDEWPILKSTLLRTKCIEYDYSNKIYKYEVKINHDKIKIITPVVESIISSKLRFTPVENNGIKDYSKTIIYDNGTKKVVDVVGENRLKYCYDKDIENEHTILYTVEINPKYYGDIFNDYSEMTSAEIIGENKTILESDSLYGKVYNSEGKEGYGFEWITNSEFYFDDNLVKDIRKENISKNGVYNNDSIEWTIAINNNAIPLIENFTGKMTGYDNIYKNLKIDEETLKLKECSINKDGKISEIKNIVLQQGQDYVYDGETNELKIYTDNLNKTDKIRPYILKFTTLLINKEVNKIENKVELIARTDDPNVSKRYVAETEVILNNNENEGTINNEKIKLKVLEEGSNNPIEGSKFIIINEDGNQMGDILITDKNGEIILDKPDVNLNYSIKQCSTINGYLISNEIISLSQLTAENGFQWDKDNSCYTYTVYNPKEIEKEEIESYDTGNIKILVVDENGETIKNAKFGIYGVDDKLIVSGETNNEGIINFSKILAGIYYIREIDIPSSYERNDYESNIELKKDDDLNIKIVYKKVLNKEEEKKNNSNNHLHTNENVNINEKSNIHEIMNDNIDEITDSLHEGYNNENDSTEINLYSNSDFSFDDNIIEEDDTIFNYEDGGLCEVTEEVFNRCENQISKNNINESVDKGIQLEVKTQKDNASVNDWMGDKAVDIAENNKNAFINKDGLPDRILFAFLSILLTVVLLILKKKYTNKSL